MARPKLKEPKVFCVGFQKTGTSSMNLALTQLGYRVASVYGRKWDYEAFKANYVERGFEILKKYDAVEDMPWPLMFRELDARYPGARFILTSRPTDAWITSICDHFGPNAAVHQEVTYGRDHPYPVGHEEHYCKVYETHNEEVREHFASRPGDLLDIDLSEGQLWERLCDFLGHPVPGFPFPRANTAAGRQTIKYRFFAKLRKWGLEFEPS